MFVLNIMCKLEMNQVLSSSISFPSLKRKISKECTCEILYIPRSKVGFQGSICDVCSEKLYSQNLNNLRTSWPKTTAR